jgi:hypothetical protein
MLGFMGSMTFIQAQGTITIQTSDGQNFTISKQIAKQIPMIKGLMEDIGESAAIPLPTVSGKEFDWIIQSLDMLNKNPNAQINTQEFSVEQLIELVNACEYLDLDHLENRLFKVLNRRNLFEGNTLENMNNITLKKFFMQHPIRSYLNSVRLCRQLNLGSSIVRVSPDGNELISRSHSDGIIKIWDLNTGRQLFEDLLHEDVGEVIISPDGSKMISRSYRAGIIKIWDLNTGMQLFEDLLHEDVDEVIISPDGNKMISWSLEPGIIKIWDLNTGMQIFEDLLHERVHGVIISLDGSKMISWPDSDGIIKIWDLNTGRQLFEDLLYERLDEVIISPDGRKFISWSFDKPVIVKIWNLIQLPTDLNFDQIKLMMWLYENRNNRNAKLSLELNDAYKSLSDNLKRLLIEKFPAVFIPRIDLEPVLVLQQEPEQVPLSQAQPEAPQVEQLLVPEVPQQHVEQVLPQQEPELVQPQVPQQPSLWQRLLQMWQRLSRTRLWTSQS